MLNSSVAPIFGLVNQTSDEWVWTVFHHVYMCTIFFLTFTLLLRFNYKSQKDVLLSSQLKIHLIIWILCSGMSFNNLFWQVTALFEVFGEFLKNLLKSVKIKVILKLEKQLDKKMITWFFGIVIFKMSYTEYQKLVVLYQYRIYIYPNFTQILFFVKFIFYLKL